MFTKWSRGKKISPIAESIDFAGKIFFEVRKCLQCGLSVFFGLPVLYRLCFNSIIDLIISGNGGYFCFKRPARSYTFSSVFIPLIFDNESDIIDNPFSEPS